MGNTKGHNAMGNAKSGLHPLLTAAAIAVTVFSAVGVATLTGLVPQSIGSQKEAAPLEIPAEVAKPLEPAIAHPVEKPANKTLKRTSTPAVKPGNVGTVQSVREVAQAGEHSAIGPIAGGVAGAVIGNQFGHGTGKKIMTVLGAAGGAYAGREIEKQARATKRWEIEVRLDSGTQETVLSELAPPFNAGDRVRVVDGRLQPV
jgi:outer membrane lipoprotein SlyB